MITSELLQFIRAQTERRMSRKDITELLLAQGGWSREDIDEAYAAIARSKTALSAASAPQVQPAPKIQTLPPERKPPAAIAPVIAPTPTVELSESELAVKKIATELNEDLLKEIAEEDFLGIFTDVLPQQHLRVREIGKPSTSATPSLASEQSAKPQITSQAQFDQKISQASRPTQPFSTVVAREPAEEPAVQIREAPAPFQKLAPAPSRITPFVHTDQVIRAQSVETAPSSIPPTLTVMAAPKSVPPPEVKSVSSPIQVPQFSRDITANTGRTADVRPFSSLQSGAKPQTFPAKQVTPLTNVPSYGAMGGKVITPTPGAKPIPRTEEKPASAIMAPEKEKEVVKSSEPAFRIVPPPPIGQSVAPLVPPQVKPKETATVVMQSEQSIGGVRPPVASSSQESTFSERLRAATPQTQAHTPLPKTARISSIAPPKRTLQDMMAQASAAPSNTVAPVVSVSQPSLVKQETPVAPVQEIQINIPDQKPLPAEKMEIVPKSNSRSSMELWLKGSEDRHEAFVSSDKPSVTTIEPRSDLNSPAVAVSPVVRQGKGMDPQIKRKILALAAVLVLVAVFTGGGYFVYTSFFGTNSTASLLGAMNAFSTVTSFGYKGETSAHLTFDGTAKGGSKGTLEYTLSMDGMLKKDANGLGDGAHRFLFSGSLQSDTVKWSTAIGGDMRMVGNTLYVHATTPPVNASVDAELLKSEWIKIDLDQIASELNLQGVGGPQKQYGQFGEGKTSDDFVSILMRNFPFVPMGRASEDTVSGVTMNRFSLSIDSKKALQGIREFYHSLTNKDLVMSDDEVLRFSDAMKKAQVSVWVGKEDGTLKKFSFQLNPNDNLFGLITTGDIALNLDFDRFNDKTQVDRPAPALSLDELRDKMEEYHSLLAVRANDKAKVALLHDITNALNAYNETKGRLPQILGELRSGGYLAGDSTTTDLGIFTYFPYSSSSTPNKAHRCTTKSKQCVAYHIGVDLDDTNDPLLSEDDDLTAEIFGEDSAGCNKAKGKACYDLFWYQEKDGQASSTSAN